MTENSVSEDETQNKSISNEIATLSSELEAVESLLTSLSLRASQLRCQINDTSKLQPPSKATIASSASSIKPKSKSKECAPFAKGDSILVLSTHKNRRGDTGTILSFAGSYIWIENQNFEKYKVHKNNLKHHVNHS